MAPVRRTQTLVLAALVVVLAFVAYRLWPGQSAAAPAASKQQSADAGARKPQPSDAGRDRTPQAEAPSKDAPRGSAARGAQQSATPEAPDVHLPALEAERPRPVEAERNLFRFRPKPTPPPPPPPLPPPRNLGPELPTPTPPPPPPPPITLKFIGYAEPRGQPKIAWLADAIGHVFEGHEGSVIEGRYKILRIGVESLDIEYLDGTGRRTIRMTGQ